MERIEAAKGLACRCPFPAALDADALKKIVTVAAFAPSAYADNDTNSGSVGVRQPVTAAACCQRCPSGGRPVAGRLWTVHHGVVRVNLWRML